MTGDLTPCWRIIRLSGDISEFGDVTIFMVIFPSLVIFTIFMVIFDPFVVIFTTYWVKSTPWRYLMK